MDGELKKIYGRLVFALALVIVCRCSLLDKRGRERGRERAKRGEGERVSVVEGGAVDV